MLRNPIEGAPNSRIKGDGLATATPNTGVTHGRLRRR